MKKLTAAELMSAMEDIGLVPVVKLEDTTAAVSLAGALRAGGINCIEVTFRAAGADEVIRAITQAYPDMLVGAGTVLTTAQVDQAIAAGAKFCVAPGLNPTVIQHCLKQGVPFIPGVANASQIEQALELGLQFVKFFPAAQAGGVDYLKALAAPYPQIRFMPTGGINLENLVAYLSCPNVVCCGGSWLLAGDITAACQTAVTKMLNFQLTHLGINCADAPTATTTAQGFAQLLSQPQKDGLNSIFVGKNLEIMKKTGYGTHGHLAVSTPNVKRAVHYLQAQGIAVDTNSARYDARGQLNFIYLQESIGGFAIHLVNQK